MSIKIFNGYKLPAMTPAKLQKVVQEFRQKVNKKQEELYYQTLASRTAHLFDVCHYWDNSALKRQLEIEGANESYSTFWSSCLTLHSEEMEDVKGDKGKFSYLHCEVIFYLLEQTILATLHTNQADYHALWSTMPEVQPYLYWSNTDRPKEVAQEQWLERGRNWAMAMEPTWIPSLQGFSAKITNSSPIPSIDNVMEYLPSFESRLENEVETVLLKAYCQKSEKGMVMAVYREFRKWLNSLEGKEAVAEKKKELAGFLIKNPTKEDFLRPISKLIENRKKED
jgi:hypothetical protein